jgi:hypothetical protein
MHVTVVPLESIFVEIVLCETERILENCPNEVPWVYNGMLFLVRKAFS